MSDHLIQPFNRLPLLETLKDTANFEIVVSSSWRFHFELHEIKTRLGGLSSYVVGATGEPATGKYPRYQEICSYIERHKISDWRALDDAYWEFPPLTRELIACDPRKGITQCEIDAAKAWLKK